MNKSKNELNELLPKILLHIDGVLKKSTDKIIAAVNNQYSNVNFGEEEFLNVIQAANYLKLKVNTIYSKVAKGELPCHKLGEKGRKLLFAIKDLELFVLSRKIKSNQEIQKEALIYLNSKK